MEVNPDRRDLQGAQAHSTSRVKWFIDKYFKGVDSVAPAIVEHCMYTLTPDEDFIIDKHPLYQNIAIGAGFSGTTCKHTRYATSFNSLTSKTITGLNFRFHMA